ncbi:MAG: phage protein Gp27 family protein [Thermodesulfobacteriota bacterium]
MERRRHGTIDHLDPDLRDQVDRLILEGVFTYEAIQGWLAERDITLSIAAIGRYAKRIRASRENAVEVRRLLEEVRAAGGDVDAAIDTLTGQTLYELLTALDPDQVRADPDLMITLVKLQGNALKRRELDLKAERLSRRETPAVAGSEDVPIARPIASPAEAVAAVKEILERKINLWLARPEAADLAGLKELRDSLELLDDLQARYLPADKSEKSLGLSDKKAAEIRAKVLGVPAPVGAHGLSRASRSNDGAPS